MTRSSGLLVLLALAFLAPVSQADDGPAFRFDAETLPPGWSVTKTIRVAEAQLGGFAQRLGAPVAALENQVLDIGGLQAGWNLISAEDEAGATRIEQTMLGMRGANFVARDGLHVYEVPGDNVLLARAVFAAAGHEETEPVAYEVQFRTALVDRPDYTRVNVVFNHFLKYAAGQIDEDQAKAIVERDTAGWTFGDSLRLRASSLPEYEATWSFTPEPSTSKTDGETTVYTFEDPPSMWGIPYVDVKGTIRVRSRFRATGRPAKTLKLPDVERWPAEPVQVLATSAARGVPAGRERALALLAALHAKVSYGGAMGSRDPVAEVLRRGQARCWDKSDVYIAMARAVGLPARQVAGWVPAIGAGHVWAEVHLAGEGWIPVDATTPWLGTGGDYVPFFLSEDGELPFAYLRMPRVERLPSR